MNSEEIINILKDDIKELKETLKEVLKSLNSISERFIVNEKDMERMINEYIRINSDFKTETNTIKQHIKEQDDLIWNEIHRMQDDSKEDVEKRIKKAKKDIIKDIKIWLAFAVLTAISAIVFSIISRIISKVV